MRIHTTLDYLDMRKLTEQSGAPIGFETLTEHESRTHARAFEVRLTGTGGRNNTGQYGAGDYDGATWDEWGAFFGALYDIDPDARCGGTAKRPAYANADHFHFETGDRFRRHDREGARCTCPRSDTLTDHLPACPVIRPTYLPADTHPRHGWVFVGEYGRGDGAQDYKCRKCGATRPGYGASEAYRRDVVNNV